MAKLQYVKLSKLKSEEPSVELDADLREQFISRMLTLRFRFSENIVDVT